MARWLKRASRRPRRIAPRRRQVRATVEALLADIATRGDAAVREMSVKFDSWDRADFRLTDAEIRACLAELAAPRRSTTSASRRSRCATSRSTSARRCSDIEVETLPGVVLGHKNIPVNSVGCYVPGGKYPLLASAHMSVVTAKVAGVPRIVTCAPPFQGRPARGDRRGAAPGRRGRDLLPRRRAGGRRDGAGHGEHRAGRHAGRPRQRLRRRGQAPALRPRRHRPVRRPDRDAGHRRRDGGWRDLRHRPARPGRARPDQPRDPADRFARSWRARRWRRSSACSTILPTAAIARQGLGATTAR